ncbi:MAG: ABC transporter permease [Candidatus Thermoplasmatota archaeon]
MRTQGGIKLKDKITWITALLFFIPILVVLYLLNLWYLLALFAFISILLIYLFGEMKEIDPTLVVFSILGILLVIFILLPLAELFNAALPDIQEALSDLEAINSIIISLSAAFVSTLIGLTLGIPLAYVMARKDFPAKSFVEGVIDLPMVVPHTVAGIALLVVFGRNGTLGKPLGKAGLQFMDAFPGIVVAMLFVSIPFIVNQIREGFEDVDPRLEKVAMSLGSDRKRTFFTVSLPLIKRNILSGAVMSWARAISEFGAVVIIAYYPKSAPVYIYEVYTSYGLQASRPIAALLLAICLSIFIVLRTISRRMSIYDKG